MPTQRKFKVGDRVYYHDDPGPSAGTVVNIHSHNKDSIVVEWDKPAGNDPKQDEYEPGQLTKYEEGVTEVKFRDA
jgi:hypothetical protein